MFNISANPRSVAMKCFDKKGVDLDHEKLRFHSHLESNFKKVFIPPKKGRVPWCSSHLRLILIWFVPFCITIIWIKS